MSDPIFFAPLRVPLIDERTGLMSREWYLFFQAMFLRIGGTNGQSNEQLVQQLLALQVAQDGAAQGPTVSLLAIDDALVPPIVFAPTFDDMLGELRAVRDQMAELTKRLDDIQQGTLL